jgi:hypothetical protein
MASVSRKRRLGLHRGRGQLSRPQLPLRSRRNLGGWDNAARRPDAAAGGRRRWPDSASTDTESLIGEEPSAMPELSLMQLGSVSTRRVAIGQIRPVRLLCLKIGPCRITGCGISIAVSHLRPSRRPALRSRVVVFGGSRRLRGQCSNYRNNQHGENFLSHVSSPFLFTENRGCRLRVGDGETCFLPQLNSCS